MSQMSSTATTTSNDNENKDVKGCGISLSLSLSLIYSFARLLACAYVDSRGGSDYHLHLVPQHLRVSCPLLREWIPFGVVMEAGDERVLFVMYCERLVW